MEGFVRNPRDDRDEFLPLDAAIVDEDALMINLIEAVKYRHGNSHQYCENIPKLFQVERILWPSFHNGFVIIRLTNGFQCVGGTLKASVNDITSMFGKSKEPESPQASVSAKLAGNPFLKPQRSTFGGKNEPTSTRSSLTPTLVPAQFRRPRRAREAELYFTDTQFNTGSPILVVPIADFDSGGYEQRGCAFYLTGSAVTVLLDSAIMGEEIFKMQKIIMTTANVYMFWNNITFNSSRWSCCFTFPKVFLVQEGIKNFPPEGTLEDLFVVLSNTKKMEIILRHFQENEGRCHASEIMAAVEIELLFRVLKRLVPLAPKFLDTGADEGYFINATRVAVGAEKWTPPFGDDFTILDSYDKLPVKELCRRFAISVGVINKVVFEPEETACGTSRQRTPLTGFWYRRMLTQNKLRGLKGIFQQLPELSQKWDILEKMQALANCKLQTEPEIFIANNLDEWKQRIALEELQLHGPVLMTPILAHLDEDRPLRGLIVFCPATNTLYVMDYLRCGLSVIQMLTLLDRLPNLKIGWSIYDAKKLALDSGMKLSATIFIREGLMNEDNMELDPTVHAAAMLLLGRKEMDVVFRNWTKTRRKFDVDLAKAILELMSLVKVVSVLLDKTPEILQTAWEKTKRSLVKPIPPFTFPDREEALATVIADAGVDEESYVVSDEGIDQFYRGFLARWFEARERGIPQDRLLPAATLLKLGKMPILGSMRHATTRQEQQWREFVKTSEFATWRTSKVTLFRKRLGLRITGENQNQCQFCILPPIVHLNGCMCGSILETLIGSLELPTEEALQDWFEIEAATTDEAREKVREDLEKMLRISANFNECLKRDQPGNIRVRFDYFAYEKFILPCEGLPETQTDIVAIVTRFVQPLGQIFNRDQPEYEVENAEWDFGCEFHANCVSHASSIPKKLYVFSGVLLFQAWQGQEGNDVDLLNVPDL